MIRPIGLADAPALAELLIRNREFFAPFEPDRPEDFFTVAGQRRRAEEAIALREADRLYRYVIEDGSTVAGLISLQEVVRGPAQSTVLGYLVDQARNGRGLATRAVAAVLEEAFGPLNLHRVVAGTRVDNHASQRVLARNAFELIGLAREAGRIGGAWRDHLLFQRLAD